MCMIGRVNCLARKSSTWQGRSALHQWLCPLSSMRRKAEYYGFGVTMPSDSPVDMSSPDRLTIKSYFPELCPLHE